MKVYKILLLLILLSTVFCFSQKTISGTVLNNRNKPVIHAKIYLDSINSKVETDQKGYFELTFSDKVSAINVYSNDYGLLSHEYKNENSMNFVFLNPKLTSQERLKKGEDFKVVHSKQTNQFIIATVNGRGIDTDANTGVYNTIYDLIRGRLPGVSVSRDNRITIRGVSSIRNISDPLFVVDGIIVSSIDFISPNNVKKVSVLKGAEASIYGAQGASGVIVVKTKQ